jgi:general secretion pathway protein I
MPAEKGFSLLEILVAFTLMAVALGVLMQAFGGGTQLLRNAQRQALAASLAQSQLVRVGTEIPLKEGEYRGEWSDFVWRIRLWPFALEFEHPRLRLLAVEVRVDWLEAGRARTYRLTTLRIISQANAPR